MLGWGRAPLPGGCKAYVAYGLALLVGVPLALYSIVPLHQAMEVVRHRYNLSAKTTKFPLTTLGRPEEFDRWIRENRDVGSSDPR